MKIEVAGNGLQVITDTVGDGGRSIRGEYTMILDGAYHPVSGQPNYDETMAKRINPRLAVGERKLARKSVQCVGRSPATARQ